MEMDRKSWILVTGGAGLIGSAIVYHLNQMGFENIVVVDHLGEGEKWQNLRALRFADYFEKDSGFYEELINGVYDQVYPFQAIFHLGNCSDTTEPDASYLMDNNFLCGKMLADYAMRRGIRMVYASSAATYGDGEVGFRDDESQVPSLRPLNKYGYSKQLFDQYLLQRGWLSGQQEGGASFVGVKYSNVFGPNEYHKGKMRSMLLRCFEQISQAGEVKLFRSYRPEYGDGEQVRDFLYVKDAAKMTVFFMTEAGRAATGLFNIGYGSTRTWNDLARAMFAAMDRPVKIQYIDMPEELKARYQYYTCLEMEKLRRAGYRETPMTLEEAAREYVAYLQKGAHLGDEHLLPHA